MLRKLRQLLTKKPSKEDPQAALILYVDHNNEPFMDIQLKDMSERTMRSLALLIAAISNPGFHVSTLEMVKEDLLSSGKETEYEQVILALTNLVNAEEFSNPGEPDDPCVCPTDML